MVLALQIVLAACFIGIAVDLLVDVNKNHKGECSKASKKLWAQGMIVGIIANFLDTLGCGSFAPSTFMYKAFKNVDDINIPGTLNVGDTFPVIFEALIFTNSVECEPIFLVAMCVSAMIGAYTMAEIITKWDVNQIRLWLGQRDARDCRCNGLQERRHRPLRHHRRGHWLHRRPVAVLGSGYPELLLGRFDGRWLRPLRTLHGYLPAAGLLRHHLLPRIHGLLRSAHAR